MSAWFMAVILGVVEGVTEFLPISSTGHLLLVERWLDVRHSDLFNTVIQSGAVLAVVAAFAGRLQGMARDWREPGTRDYLLKLALAFGITGAGGLVLKALDFKLPEEAGPVAWAILVGGILMLAVERWLAGRTLRAEISWGVAVAVGAAQLVAAVFPGASRSGTTILAALAFGLNRGVATEFSFLVGVPTLLAAGAVQIASASRHGELGNEDWGMLLLATAVAAVTAFASVKWLLRYVQSHTFDLFGWYRVGLGALILWLGR